MPNRIRAKIIQSIKSEWLFVIGEWLFVIDSAGCGLSGPETNHK